MAAFVGTPHEALLGPSTPGSVSVALVTHLHSDHADPGALEHALAADGVILRPEPAAGEGLQTIAMAAAEAGLSERGLATRTVAPWETVEIGPFSLTAVPAVDGFGDPQVSWVVAAEGRRIIHCGDTLFHGWWWLIKMRCGPFDAAFLPVNGPTVDLPHRQPASTLPAAMDPFQAAQAAALLEAELAVPIHYDTLNQPPTYVQVDHPAESFVRAAAARSIPTQVLTPGASLDFG